MMQCLSAGGDAPVVSPLAGAPGFVKAAAAATPAVSGPSAGPLASVAEHTNAAAAAAESGSATGAASAFGSAGSAADAAEGNGGAPAADGVPSPAAKSAAPASAGSQAGAPPDSRLDGSNREPDVFAAGSSFAGEVAACGVPDGLPPQIQTGAASSSSGGGGPPGPGSGRYSMLAALPPGGVDRSGGAGPPSLGRDSMPAAVGWQVRVRPRCSGWSRSKCVSQVIRHTCGVQTVDLLQYCRATFVTSIISSICALLYGLLTLQPCHISAQV